MENSRWRGPTVRVHGALEERKGDRCVWNPRARVKENWGDRDLIVQTTVCILRRQWGHNEGFQARGGTGFSLGYSRALPQEGASSHSVELRVLPFTTHKPCLHKGAENLLTSPGLKWKEKRVLSKENNSNARKEAEKGWIKGMLGKKTPYHLFKFISALRELYINT